MTSEQEINLDWNKIVRDNKKAGFRDGVATGREQNFQENFDVGYAEGFKNGFLMGKYKGTLKALSLINKESYEEDQLLKESRKGWCVMCKDKTLLERTLEETIFMQTENSDVLLNRLQTKYKLNICKELHL